MTKQSIKSRLGSNLLEFLSSNQLSVRIFKVTGLTFLTSLCLKLRNSQQPFDGTSFQFHSKNFIKIVECSETLDGLECFRSYQDDLQQELMKLLSPKSYLQTMNCLNIASSKANDLALLLNIQTCFHHAEIGNHELTVTSESRVLSAYFQVLEFIFAFSFFYLLLKFIGFMINPREESDYIGKERISKDDIVNVGEMISEKLSLLSKTQMSLIDSLYELLKENRLYISKVNESIEQHASLRKDVESLMLSNSYLRGAVQKVNELLLGRYSLSPSLVSPHENASIYESRRRQPYSSVTAKSSGRFELNSSYSGSFYKPSTSYTTPDLAEDAGNRSKTLVNARLSSQSEDAGDPKISNADVIKSNFKDSVLRAYKEKNGGGEEVAGPKQDIAVDANEPLKYKNLKKFNSNGTKYKRIFMRGRGWVSTKVLEEEEKRLGKEALIPLQN